MQKEKQEFKDFCQLALDKWGEDANWVNQYDGGPHEANFLKLDCSKLKKVFGWSTTWNVEQAIDKTVQWTKAYQSGQDASEVMNQQIEEFLSNNN